MSFSCCSMGLVLSNYIYMLIYRSRSLAENGDDKVDQCRTPIKKSLASSNQENYLVSGWKWLIYLQCVKNYRDFFFVLWSKFVNKVKNMRIEKQQNEHSYKNDNICCCYCCCWWGVVLSKVTTTFSSYDWLTDSDWTRLDETNE